MRENNAANTGNAVIANPVLGPSGLSVETLHGTPRTGEEKVRTDGNKNRQRRAEMTRPLDRWSIELQAFQLSMDFPHALFDGFRQMLTTRPRQVQKLVYQVESDKAPIGYLGISEDGEDLANPVLVGLSPHTLRGTNVSLPIQGALHNASGTVSDGATQMGLNVLQGGFVVIPLGYAGLGEEITRGYGASFGLVGSRVLMNPDSAISPEEAPELGNPSLPGIHGTVPRRNACVELRIGAKPEVEPFSLHAPIIAPF